MDSRAPPGHKDQKAIQACKARRDHKARRAHMARRDPKACKVFKGRKDHKARKDHKETQALVSNWLQMETMTWKKESY